MQAFIRAAYGTLLFGTLLSSLGPSRWFFLSERYGGYAKSDPITDRIQNPVILPCILVLWFLCAGMMMLGYYPLASTFINLLLCRYFFIHMRWKGLLRGMGAPGFMTYWLGACIFFLEYGRLMDPTGAVRAVALSAFRIDFAAIMLSAGFYKFFCGYPKNQGMEYGMVNPWWGYWWRFYQKVPPDHLLFKSLNHLAYGTEIVAGILMLIPATRTWGAWLIIISFFFIATHIRLGFLCEMVMISALIFMEPGSFADHLSSPWAPGSVASAVTSAWLVQYVNSALTLFLVCYIVGLPLAHGSLWYNLFAQKSLPRFIQTVVERYTNFFGIIIWRVFTIDLINFFAKIYLLNSATGNKELYSRLGMLDWQCKFRYWHVGESICFCSLFTTLKYYPSNLGLFHERLMRYAKTIPCPPGSVVYFEYISVKKSPDRFEFVPVAAYVVDTYQLTIEENLLDGSFSARDAHRASPVREGGQPGSYAPLTTS
jgi:hypothetical protein